LPTAKTLAVISASTSIMRKITIIFILFTSTLWGQTHKSDFYFYGSWKNCGTYTADTKSVLLFRDWTDTCDTYGTCCNQTFWEFIKVGDINRELGNTLRIRITASCKKKILLTCSMTAPETFSWVVDNEKNQLILKQDKKTTVFQIKVVDKNQLHLLRL
jgi:hypothetical protein